MPASSPDWILHTDGAAKGNPGPAGIGVVLFRAGENEPVAAIGEFIGETTNNVAEYRALLRGLSEALERGARAIEVRTDSELMARQIGGRYKVSAPQLLPLFEEARRLLARFDRATVTHVLRGKNALADKLANQGVAAGRDNGEAPKAEKTEKKTKAAKATNATRPAKTTPKDSPFPHTYSTQVGDEHRIWNVERLWELARDLPVAAIPLEQVVAILDQDCWFGGKAPTLREVARHARRIYEADFSHPIVLSASGELMDGGHRIARAWLEGRNEIAAVQFREDPAPDEIRPAKPARRRRGNKPQSPAST